MRNETLIQAMVDQPRRLRREMKTVGAMIELFCQAKHDSARGLLCSSCEELLVYAMRRLEKCPFSSEKPACSHCLIHCYKTDKREQVKEVMRYSGPRMLWRHPMLAIRHLLDERREPPCRDEEKR